MRKTLRHYLINVDPKSNKSKGWVFYPTFDLAEDVFVNDFIELLDSAYIDFDYNQSKHRYKSRYGDLKLYSSQNPKRAVGSNLTFVGVDEFDIEDTIKMIELYKKILGRLRGSPNAQFYIATTPEGYKATYQLFVKEGKGTLIKAKTYDNPYLDREFVESLLKDYDEQMRKMYLDGEFVNLNGKQAYYPFSRDRHIMKDKSPYVFQTKTLYIGIDFNIDHFSLVVSEIVNGILMVGMEYRFANFRTKDAVRLINELYNDFQIYICPDMTGDSRKTSADFTDIIILRQGETKLGQFRILGDVNPSHRDRINTTNNLLDKNKVLIHDSCVWLIGDLEKVVTDAYGFIEKKQEQQGLVHMSDAFGYTVINLFPLTQRKIGYAY